MTAQSLNAEPWRATFQGCQENDYSSQRNSVTQVPQIGCIEWRPVAENNSYLVSNHGTVCHLINRDHPERKQFKILKNVEDKDGYQYLRIGGHKYLIHRLVYSTFVGPLCADQCICHLDGNRKNNKVENLLQASQAENISHKKVHGTSQDGEKH